MLDQEEWQAKGEPYGNEAPVTAIIDGSELLVAVNYEGGELKDELEQICEALGYRYELGFCWSIHFYPLP